VAGPYVGATDTYVAGDGRQVGVGTHCAPPPLVHPGYETPWTCIVCICLH